MFQTSLYFVVYNETLVNTVYNQKKENSCCVENIIVGIKDTNLKLTLAFGIGLHHAGLHERDRKTVEELFVNSKIQVRNIQQSPDR